jgi:hypothetical protein
MPGRLLPPAFRGGMNDDQVTVAPDGIDPGISGHYPTSQPIDRQNPVKSPEKGT